MIRPDDPRRGIRAILAAGSSLALIIGSVWAAPPPGESGSPREEAPAAPQPAKTKKSTQPAQPTPDRAQTQSGPQAQPRNQIQHKSQIQAQTRAAGPVVRSRAASDRLRPISPFLRPPGSVPGDRYSGGAVDLMEAPPWRQADFFGIRAEGRFFIYVLDGSGSMIDDDRFARATIELRRSVNALKPPQRFEVLFYNDEPVPMLGGPIARPADQESKEALRRWLRTMEPEGGTVPLPALAQAVALRPDAIFFLSDGALPEETVEAVAGINRGKIPIHCIDLAGGLGGDQLRRIAAANGGTYAARAGSLHAAP